MGTANTRTRLNGCGLTQSTAIGAVTTRPWYGGKVRSLDAASIPTRAPCSASMRTPPQTTGARVTQITLATSMGTTMLAASLRRIANVGSSRPRRHAEALQRLRRREVETREAAGGHAAVAAAAAGAVRIRSAATGGEIASRASPE